MTIVIHSKDCGNSPKNQRVENLSVGLAMGDRQTVSDLVTDDVQWSMIGGKTLRGRVAVLQVLENLNTDSIVKLTVHHVITHGKSGAVNGTVQFQDTTRSFCDVFEFSNTKGTHVCYITSYQIDI